MNYKIFSAISEGTKGNLIEVDVCVLNGIPQISITGLADQTVREAKERLLAAFHNNGIRLPNKRYIVNLSPNELKKEGGHLDLPIGLALVLSAKSSFMENEPMLKIGALGAVNIDGSLQETVKIFGLVETLQNECDVVVVPEASKSIKHYFPSAIILGVKTFKSLLELIEGASVETLRQISQYQLESMRVEDGSASTANVISTDLDYKQVMGHEIAKQAVVYAVAGKHHLLFYGPPGCGKSMLLKRIPSIQPQRPREGVYENKRDASLLGFSDFNSMQGIQEPFRMLHSHMSLSALIGGRRGSVAGELFLANNGVVFMDEMPEFKRDVLEGLRGPLEDRRLHLAKVNYKADLQAAFTLVATANPCPCGYSGYSEECSCNAADIKRYFSKISEPLMDRFDIKLRLSYAKVTSTEMVNSATSESPINSEEMKKWIEQIREWQYKRFRSENYFNAYMEGLDLFERTALSNEARYWLDEKKKEIGIRYSHRHFDKIIRLGRTIADYQASQTLDKKHLLEASYYNRRE